MKCSFDGMSEIFDNIKNPLDQIREKEENYKK